ncbi:putative neugrin-like protein DDB_G0288135 [Maniola jurtina]|uniref:putative neugrin-like protein DDB_G0288135 n=1 Tax=Maniola jurtina TaxID=191418 RepID=UPI001E68C11A|nr:putative neugrin-like protein DDB_G0288135 [Maniola jurtina]
MEEITEILKNIQLEMQTQKEELHIFEKSITESINNNINQKFSEIESKYTELNNKVEEQEKRIDLIEKYIRRKNLVIFGIEEKEKDYHDLTKEVLTLINEKMSVELNTSEIESLHRKGKKGDKIRPIILSLTTVSKKIQIIKCKNTLNNTPYYIKDDYPQKILKERITLNEKVKKLRNEGKNAILKYNKIIILNEGIQQSRNKRNLQESPENSFNNQNQRKLKMPLPKRHFKKSKNSKVNTIH